MHALNFTIRHLHRHWRFYAAAALGLVVYFVMPVAYAPVAGEAAGDAFFLTYLFASAVLLANANKMDLKKRAAEEDEGIMLVLLLALFAVGFSIVGIFILLNQGKRPDGVPLVLALAAAPLGWFMLHTMAAFHYVDLYYFDCKEKGAGSPLEFPGTKEPDLWDFLYFSFVIGMTAQVSDVQVCNGKMLRAVSGHSIVSFFFNTVLIAMAVNAAVATAG